MIEIPAPLTSLVAEPDVSAIRTNGDMLEILLDYQLSLRLCNGKLRSLEAAYGKHGVQ